MILKKELKDALKSEQKTSESIYASKLVYCFILLLKFRSIDKSIFKASAITNKVDIVGLVSPLSIRPICDNGISASFASSSCDI